MQQWYSLGDEAMEDALYEIASMRQFAQLSLDKALELIADESAASPELNIISEFVENSTRGIIR